MEKPIRGENNIHNVFSQNSPKNAGEMTNETYQNGKPGGSASHI